MSDSKNKRKATQEKEKGKKAPAKKLKEGDMRNFVLSPEKKKEEAEAPVLTEESESLLTLLTIPEDGTLKSRLDFEKKFEAIAEGLLNRSLLYINGEPHRLSEVEFYYKGPGHVDIFTHCDENQRQAGLWYFHRHGGKYKSGTYKGLDIAFGRPSAPDPAVDPVYGGILIRAIEDVKTGTLTEGPCLVVDLILRKTGFAKIEDLVASSDFLLGVGKTKETPAGCPLYVSMAVSDHLKAPRTIHRSARVGLSMKTRPEKDSPQDFVMRPYRFMAGELNRWKKGRQYLISTLGATMDRSKILSLVKMTPANLDSWLAALEKGKGMSGDNFYLQKIDGIDILHLAGFCLKNACP